MEAIATLKAITVDTAITDVFRSARFTNLSGLCVNGRVHHVHEGVVRLMQPRCKICGSRCSQVHKGMLWARDQVNCSENIWEIAIRLEASF